MSLFRLDDECDVGVKVLSLVVLVDFGGQVVAAGFFPDLSAVLSPAAALVLGTSRGVAETPAVTVHVTVLAGILGQITLGLTSLPDLY